MSRLSRFIGKTEELIIGGEKYEIKPLEPKDQILLYNYSDPSKKDKAFRDIMKVSVQEEGITDEELDDMTVGIKGKFMKAIFDANGMGEEIEAATKKLAFEQSKKDN